MPLSEIDSEVRERNQMTTRALCCPDGVTRIVLMSGWFWNNYDWLCWRNYYRPDEDLQVILRHIAEVECAEMTDEERFSAMLQGAIFEWMCILFPFYRIGHPDNDNTRPPGAAAAVETSANAAPRRRLRLYLGRGGRIGQLPF